MQNSITASNTYFAYSCGQNNRTQREMRKITSIRKEKNLNYEQIIGL